MQLDDPINVVFEHGAPPQAEEILVQINDDGTHAILPVATRMRCDVDHARMPVMWLRHADGKLRRDDSRAAALQPNTPVAERGRVRGAPGLAAVVDKRVQAWRRGPCRKRERKREWVRAEQQHDRLRGRDKRPQCAARSVGCCCLRFLLIRQCASWARNVCLTINSLRGFYISHIAKAGHG